jgi:transposase
VLTGSVLFRAKRADRVKLLFWDGTGLMLVSERLEQGGFKWPPIMDGVMRLSAGQLAGLIEELDWTRVHVRRVVRPQATQ